MACHRSSSSLTFSPFPDQHWFALGCLPKASEESPSIFYSFKVRNDHLCLAVFSQVLQKICCVEVGLVAAADRLAELDPAAGGRPSQEIGKKAALRYNTHRTGLFTWPERKG